jgi:hypothetical protein
MWDVVKSPPDSEPLIGQGLWRLDLRTAYNTDGRYTYTMNWLGSTHEESPTLS